VGAMLGHLNFGIGHIENGRDWHATSISSQFVPQSSLTIDAWVLNVE
jgi:hypothetical protein